MTAPALWSANFRFYFGARTTSLLGDAMLPVALSIGLLQAGYGTAGVGYALGAWTAAVAVCMVFGGVLADRFTPRRMMVLADFTRLGIQAAVAVLFWTGIPSLAAIVALQVVAGVATAMFQPGVASMVPQVADDVQQANGVLRVAESVAGVFGPALAGILVSVSGPGVVFALYSLTYAVSATCLLALRLPPRSPRSPASPSSPGSAGSAGSALGSFAGDEVVGESMLRGLAAGWREFRARTWLWTVITIFLVYGCFVAGLSLPVGADLVVTDLGSPALGAGMAAFGGGGVLGGAIAMRLRGGRPLAMGAAGWALFAAFPLMPALRPGVVLLCIGWAIAGAGLAFWSVLWATTVQTQIPADLLNRVYAYDVAGSLVSLALGRTLAGPLAELFGQRPLMYAATALGLLCATLLVLLPSTRTLEALTP